jgi:hypothetical protein
MDGGQYPHIIASHLQPPIATLWVLQAKLDYIRYTMECILDPLSAKIKARKGKLVGKSITTQK